MRFSARHRAQRLRHSTARFTSVTSRKPASPKCSGRFRLKYAVLRALVDGRAESGPETLMRLMLRALGCDVELQVDFDGIGRVDLVVDGWLVIECDSKEFHESWDQQVKDRNRDLALAARGFHTLRLTAGQIMYRDDEVLAAVKGLLATR